MTLTKGIETPQELYTGIATLEKYIDDTKERVANSLPTICNTTTRNLTPQQYSALLKLKRHHHTITIKPADKNLGIVVLDTDDYISQCMAQLSDATTYRLVSTYPITEIESKLSQILLSFRNTLITHNKSLYSYLSKRPDNSRIPQFYGIPKIHKKYEHLPPIRPIVSQSSSRLTLSRVRAQLLRACVGQGFSREVAPEVIP